MSSGPTQAFLRCSHTGHTQHNSSQRPRKSLCCACPLPHCCRAQLLASPHPILCPGPRTPFGSGKSIQADLSTSPSVQCPGRSPQLSPGLQASPDSCGLALVSASHPTLEASRRPKLPPPSLCPNTPSLSAFGTPDNTSSQNALPSRHALGVTVPQRLSFIF